MKNLNKLLVVLMLLALAMTMAVPSLANETTYTLTVDGNAENHTYQAYQVFKGMLNEDGVLTEIGWGNGVDGNETLADLKAATGFGTTNPFADSTSAAAVAKVLGGWDETDNAAELDLFAEIVEDNLTTTYKTSTADTTDTKQYTISGLTAGYYLIKDADGTVTGHDSYTKLILKIAGNSTVAPKGQVPSVTKHVDTQVDGDYGKYVDVSMGDTVYFMLVGTLPSNYADYENYSYEFVDTLPAGLNYGQIAEVYSLDKDGNETAIAASAYTAVCENRVLKVTFADLKASLSDLTADDKIVVKFSAVLNTAADIGNDGNMNKVYLNFANNPNGTGTGTTPEDKAYVFTFALEVVKVDGNDNAVFLPGATFTLQNADDEYYIAGTDSALPTWGAQADAAELVTNGDGKLVIPGLDAGTYTLTETVAPSGYNKLEAPVTVEVTANYENNLVKTLRYSVTGTGADRTDSEVENLDAGTVTVQIQNFAGSTLPSTGGIGTTVFYVLGGILVLGAVVLLITKKRMEA